MSTLTARDQDVLDTNRTIVSQDATAAPAKRRGFSLSRLLVWYRTAVLSPATDDEKAEWQKSSF